MKLPHSIRGRLRLTYIGLATVPLLLIGLVLTWGAYNTQRTQLVNLQQEVAHRVAAEVNAFMHSLETDLLVTAKVSNLLSRPQKEQKQILSQLRTVGNRTSQNIYVELALLDVNGQEMARSSYLGNISEDDLQDRSQSAEFLAFQNDPEATVYYGPVYFDAITNQPLITITIPLKDIYTEVLTAVLVANVNLKEISNLVAGEEGEVYIINEEGRVIAHPNPSIVFQGTILDHQPEKGEYPSLENDMPMLIGVDRGVFGEQELTVVAATSVDRVLDLVVNSWVFILGSVLITISVATLLALIATNHITRPILALVKVAEAIREGDLLKQAATPGLEELDTLAYTFNSMTAQLRQTLAGLEQRVADRTQALKTSAEVSRYLSTILDTNKLVTEVADLVRSAFNYYHVNIYLLDKTAENLVLVAATGEAGRMMLTHQHHLPYDKGLVGQAATTNHPALVADVTQSLDWLPNPWLPDTKAELTIPIARGAQVLGVLDIQHQVISGLKQEDIDLMQSIANQLAVALLNAQSFEQLVAEKLTEVKQKEEAEGQLEIYRRSPMGQAELFAQQLLTRPENSLVALHQLAQTAGHNLETAALLSHLPKLLDDTHHDVNEQTLHDVALLAKMAEGFNYLFAGQNAPELLLLGLRTLTKQLERPSIAGWHGSAEALAIYQLCQLAVEANTIPQITQLDWQGVLKHSAVSDSHLVLLLQTLVEFQAVIEALMAYERITTLQDKLAYLVTAVERLRHIERQARTKLGSADVSIILRITENWQAIVTGALSELQTQAKINCRLLTRHTWHNDVISLMLNVRNDGRGAAINLRVCLLPGSEYTLLDETAELQQLTPGEEEQVILRVHPRMEQNITQFRARFIVFYDDPRGPNQSDHFADVVELMVASAQFQYIPNPYIVGTPLEAGSALFFGREDLLATIQENLAATHRNNVVLIGQRRMGKTSLLKQLRLRLDSTYVPVYLDGQVMGLDPGLANFFLNLATEITFALEDQGVEMTQPNLEEFESSPAATFERQFLTKVLQIIGERHLLILFDEFEELEGAVQRGHLDASIFGYLRHLMQHHPALSFIFCGTRRLEELAADYWNVLFNISLYYRVGYLFHEEAMRLVQQPVEPFEMRYDDLALDKMWRVTAGHPYFLQLLCHSLVNRHNKTQRNYVTVADVNAALDEILTSGEAHFIYLWTESTIEERMVLVAMSRMIPLTGLLQAVQIVDYLAERGVRVERRVIRDAMYHLMLRDILKIEDMDRGGESVYRWQLGLLGLWAEKYKSLGRVVDEVTT